MSIVSPLPVRKTGSAEETDRFSAGSLPVGNLRSTPPERSLAIRAGLLARGSTLALPGLPDAERQWTMGRGLAAYSCGGSLGFGVERLTEFPLSSGLHARRTLISVIDKRLNLHVKRIAGAEPSFPDLATCSSDEQSPASDE